jgi:hypothetical protein
MSESNKYLRLMIVEPDIPASLGWRLGPSRASFGDARINADQGRSYQIPAIIRLCDHSARWPSRSLRKIEARMEAINDMKR